MTRDDNDKLNSLSTRWKWEGDWMTCRFCKRHLIASRDGEEFMHAADCKNSTELHPWTALRNILVGQPQDSSNEAHDERA